MSVQKLRFGGWLAARLYWRAPRRSSIQSCKHGWQFSFYWTGRYSLVVYAECSNK